MIDPDDIRAVAGQGIAAMRFGVGPASGRRAWTGRFIGQLADPTDLCAALAALRQVHFAGSVGFLPAGAAAVIREVTIERYGR